MPRACGLVPVRRAARRRVTRTHGGTGPARSSGRMTRPPRGYLCPGRVRARPLDSDTPAADEVRPGHEETGVHEHGSAPRLPSPRVPRSRRSRHSPRPPPPLPTSARVPRAAPASSTPGPRAPPHPSNPPSGRRTDATVTRRACRPTFLRRPVFPGGQVRPAERGTPPRTPHLERRKRQVPVRERAVTALTSQARVSPYRHPRPCHAPAAASLRPVPRRPAHRRPGHALAGLRASRPLGTSASRRTPRRRDPVGDDGPAAPRTPAAPEAPTAPPARGTAPADRTGTPAPHRAAEPDPALSWSAPMAPGGVPGGRPTVISFGEPERYDGGGPSRPSARRTRAQVVAAAVCLVLGAGLIGGAVTGAWLADGPEGPGTRHAFTVAGDLWHDVPVDQLFPPTVQGGGAGPGEADRVWTRIAVAPTAAARAPSTPCSPASSPPSAASACCAPPTPTPPGVTSPPSACCSPRPTRQA